MTLDRLKGMILHWPRVARAWHDLVTVDSAYAVTEAPKAGISVRHLVRATIYRNPVEEMVKKGFPRYYTAKRIYEPGIISDTVYVAPEANDREQACAIVAERLAMKPVWSEVIRSRKELRAGVVAERGDVVAYSEVLE